MFDSVLGLPAHPLFIHAAVVLVPLLVLAGILYAFWPAARRHVRWLLIVLAVVTPGAVYFAKESGEAFSRNPSFQSPQMQASIETHDSYATVLFGVVIFVALFSLVLAYLVRPVAEEIPAGLLGHAVVRWAVAVVTVVLGLLSLYYCFKTGDTGAHMVWDGYQS